MKCTCIALALLAALALAGCAALQGPNLSVDQLKAMAADKSAAIVCTQIVGAGGAGTVVTVNMDQRVIIDGGITVEPNCKTTITNTTPPKPAPATPPAQPPTKATP